MFFRGGRRGEREQQNFGFLTQRYKQNRKRKGEWETTLKEEGKSIKLENIITLLRVISKKKENNHPKARSICSTLVWNCRHETRNVARMTLGLHTSRKTFKTVDVCNSCHMEHINVQINVKKKKLTVT